jgi:DHA2 family multidrug resistance protein
LRFFRFPFPPQLAPNRGVPSQSRTRRGGLSASQDEISWVQTSYLIGEIVMIPLSGWLSCVMSTRWLFAASAAGFTAASLLCGSAWDIHSMIAFRTLQGFLGGPMIPTVFTSAFVFFEGKQRVFAASIVGGLASIAPTFVGGWITDTWSWHWLFYINVVPGALVAVLVPLLVRIDKPNLALLKDADYLGIALMALFLGCLEYDLEEGPRWDWFGDDTIRICAWISGLAGAGFVVRSLTFARPVVDSRALAIRNFSLGRWFSFVTGIGIFGTVYLTPLFLGRVRGFDAWQIGMALLSAGLFQLLAVPIYGLLANRIDLRWLMMFGLACFGMAMWLFTSMTHDWGWHELLLPQAFRGFAQQFCVAPMVTLTLGILPPDRLRSASGLFNLMRNLGGSNRHRNLRHHP